MELNAEQKRLAGEAVEDILAPDGPIMINVETPPPTSKVSNPLVDGIIEWGNTLDFEGLKENSVLLIHLNLEAQDNAEMFQMIVVKKVLEPRFDILKSKKVSVLFLPKGFDISALSEADMNKAGWFKKEPSRIITI